LSHADPDDLFSAFVVSDPPALNFFVVVQCT
jgi:hypothetical protein